MVIIRRSNLKYKSETEIGYSGCGDRRKSCVAERRNNSVGRSLPLCSIVSALYASELNFYLFKMVDKTITVSDETYEKIKSQLQEDEVEEVDVNALDDFVGKKLFIRTVTYHCTGKVVKRVGKFFELKDGAFIGDSGRFHDALSTGELSEVEPTGQMWVNTDSIVDMFPWSHKLPKKQV